MMSNQPIKIAAPLNKLAAIQAINQQYKGNSSAAQCQRALAALKLCGFTTFELMRIFDIYCPPARIRQLRKSGYNIITLWQIVFTESNTPHRVGLYVLQSEAANG